MTTPSPRSTVPHETVLGLDPAGALFGLELHREADGWKTTLIGPDEELPRTRTPPALAVQDQP
ncbi:hypothetical protein [Myceligenerans crystallogenes]|uniref:Uncharacterized protein n=1 Tax=Myceligenerans crystallogenes TaxID=316335 RepID=A0ABN2NL44_9MICO